MDDHRRNYLRLCAGVFASGLVGCTGSDGSASPSTTATDRPTATTTNSPSSTATETTSESGTTTEAGPVSLDPAWTASSFEGGARDVALGDGRVSTALTGGRAVAFDAATGEELWRTDVAAGLDGAVGSLAAPLTVTGDALYVLTTASEKPREYLHALDPATGERRWTFSEREFLDVVGQVGDDVYLSGYYIETTNPPPEQDPAGEGRVRALSAGDGAVRWERTIPGLDGAVAAEHGFYAAEDGRLHGFSRSGTLRWMVDADYDSPPATTETAVLFGGQGSALAAYDPGTGDRRWQVTDLRGPETEIERVVVTSDRIFASGTELVSVAHDGTTVWHRVTGNRIAERLLASDVLYGDGGTGVAAYARADGSRRWTFDPEDETYVQTVAAVDAGVFVHPGIGTDYEWVLLDDERGTPRATFATGQPFKDAASRGNTLFVGSEGRVHAVEVPPEE